MSPICVIKCELSDHIPKFLAKRRSQICSTRSSWISLESVNRIIQQTCSTNYELQGSNRKLRGTKAGEVLGEILKKGDQGRVHMTSFDIRCEPLVPSLSIPSHLLQFSILTRTLIPPSLNLGILTLTLPLFISVCSLRLFQLPLLI
jgi:hypothetical protein